MAIPRAMRALCLSLVLVALLAAPAVAQVPGAVQPQVMVTLDVASLELGAGNTTAVEGVVANPGQFDGTVNLEIAAPEGWTVSVEPSSSFSLAAGAQAPVTITFIAPAAGLGAATGDASFGATLTDSAGRTASATASVGVTRVDPPVVVPPPPYGLYAAIAGAVLLALATAGIVLWRRRQARLRAEAEEAARRAAHEAYMARETGVGISLLDGPVRFGAKRELVYRCVVENRTQRPRLAVIGSVDVPAGWTVAPSVPKLPLAPGERVTVTFFVACADHVPPESTVPIVFRARPEEAQELDERVTLEAKAPDVRVPALDPHKSVSVAREPVAPKPVLRK